MRVKERTGEKRVSKAVRSVLESFLQRGAFERFLNLAGKIDIQNVWEEMEEEEVKELEKGSD
jgi:hypothetical protein